MCDLISDFLLIYRAAAAAGESHPAPVFSALTHTLTWPSLLSSRLSTVTRVLLPAVPATLSYCPHPNSSTLDGYTFRHHWSATLNDFLVFTLRPSLQYSNRYCTQQVYRTTENGGCQKTPGKISVFRKHTKNSRKQKFFNTARENRTHEQNSSGHEKPNT